MSKSTTRLLLVLCAFALLAVWFGCSQPDDVITSVDRTTMFLTPERLPEPPDGMVYELWVSTKLMADGLNDISAADLTSLGRFSYIDDDTLIAFMNVDGTRRADSNQFQLEDDLWKYENVFVSVEQVNDADPSMPGAVMLIDNIIRISDRFPKLIFPESEDLANATATYNIESVSDNNRRVSDGSGVWFCNYRIVLDSFPDTLDLISVTFDTFEIVPIVDPETGDTLNLDEIYRPRACSVTNVQTLEELVLYSQDTLLLNIDSFIRSRVEFDVIRCVDSTPPFMATEIDAIEYSTTFDLAADTVRYDIFTQDDWGFPSLEAWGWSYEGWAVSSHIPSSSTAGDFTPPAWTYKTIFNNFIPGDTGKIVSTGRFQRIDSADLENPFTLDVKAGDLIVEDEDTGEIDTIEIFKRPPYPGEDFLDQAALMSRYGVNSIDIAPAGANGSYESTVLISAEPMNRVDGNSNFPLILFLGALPATITSDTLNVPMLNTTSTVPGSNSGLPQVGVRYTRF